MKPISPIRPRLVREFGYTAPLTACAFDPARDVAYAGAWDRNLIAWSLPDGRMTAVPGHASWVVALAASARGNCLLAGDYTGAVICWSLAGDAPKLRWRADAHRGPAKAVACSADGSLAATGGGDGAVRVWDLRSGKAVRSLAGQSGHVEAVAFHPDGKHLLATGRDCTVKGWVLDTGEEAFTYTLDALKAHNPTQDIQYGGGRGLAFSRAGATLACGGRAGYARPAAVALFDGAGKQTRLLTSPLSDSICTGVVFHPEGCLLTFASSVAAGELGVWLPDREKPEATIATPGPGAGLALAPDGKRLAVAMARGKGRTYPESGSLGLYDLAGGP